MPAPYQSNAVADSKNRQARSYQFFHPGKRPWERSHGDSASQAANYGPASDITTHADAIHRLPNSTLFQIPLAYPVPTYRGSRKLEGSKSVAGADSTRTQSRSRSRGKTRLSAGANDCECCNYFCRGRPSRNRDPTAIQFKPGQLSVAK